MLSVITTVYAMVHTLRYIGISDDEKVCPMKYIRDGDDCSASVIIDR